MSMLKSFLRALFKPFCDLASILYDDLDFQVMSLPRVGTALLTLAIVGLVVEWVRTERACPYFKELCALCGALWGTYLFKRRGNPPEEVYQNKGGEKGVDMDKNAGKKHGDGAG